MSDVRKVNDALLKWLELRLDRANFVEKKLNSLIRKNELSDAEVKRYNELLFDSKNITIKDVIAIYEALGGESESSGFEDFD